MAGIVVPMLFLLVIMAIFAYFCFYFEVSSQFVVGLPGPPLERALVFPMAVVPNLWGVWIQGALVEGPDQAALTCGLTWRRDATGTSPTF
jgi:hypothetical protein